MYVDNFNECKEQFYLFFVQFLRDVGAGNFLDSSVEISTVWRLSNSNIIGYLNGIEVCRYCRSSQHKRWYLRFFFISFGACSISDGQRKMERIINESLVKIIKKLKT